MQFKKVFIRDDNKALLVCDGCGEALTLDYNQPNSCSTAMKVNCKCSAEFNVLGEKRRHYRKFVELFGGACKTDGKESPQGQMLEVVVKDLSRTGISFSTSSDHDFKQGDYLRISFTLDDPKRSRITLNVVVKRVSGRDVGAQITANEIPKSLSFYLLP